MITKVIKEKFEICPDDGRSHLCGALAVRLCPRQQTPFLGYTSSAPPGKIPPTHQPEAVSTQHQELHTPCTVCGLLSQPGTWGTQHMHTHTHPSMSMDRNLDMDIVTNRKRWTHRITASLFVANDWMNDDKFHHTVNKRHTLFASRRWRCVLWVPDLTLPTSAPRGCCSVAFSSVSPTPLWLLGSSRSSPSSKVQRQTKYRQWKNLLVCVL